MSENQNRPEENLPDKEQQTIPDAQPPSSLTTQPQQPMEVHHHGHVHEKKKWKEYGFQFLMLFLAVALGFAAEKFREYQVEKNTEKEYIESLVIDLKNDSAFINATVEQIFAQAKVIEALQLLFSSDMKKGSEEIQLCYKLSPYLAVIYPLNFNQGTVTQLLSSGSMRLIKKGGAADSILAYYNYLKFVEEQVQLYKYYINKCTDVMYNVYEIDSLKSELTESGDSIRIKPAATEGRQFNIPPRVEVKKLMAAMELAKASAFNFGLLLSNTAGKKATDLIRFLENTYHIKHKHQAENKEPLNKEPNDSLLIADSLRNIKGKGQSQK